MFYHFVPLLPKPRLSHKISKKAPNTDIVQIKQIEFEFGARECKLIVIKT
jgi:hypothetical protein